jgi:anti-sigma regulatory factor (Ser/Thr protein kinase)
MKPLTVPGALESLGPISEYVMAAAGEAGLDTRSSYRLRLAVDEIATNIIVHGYDEAGLDGDLDIWADIDEHALKISLEDSGAAYDPSRRPLPDDLHLPPEQRNIGGLGVFLALQGVDTFRYERIGSRNRNIFIMNRT